MHIKSSSIFFFAAIFCFQSFPAGAEKGSFLILYKTYLYETSKMELRVIRTQQKKAYKITDFLPDTKNQTIKFEIQIPSAKETETQEGYIPKIELDKEENKNGMFYVYATLPKNSKDSGEFIPISKNQLLSRTNRENSKKIQNVDWEKVTYRVPSVKKYWVYAFTGIYRPDLNSKEFNRIYAKAGKSGYGASNLVKILSGYVNSGYSQKWVGLALGKPLEKNKKDNSIEEWVYPARKIIFKKKRVNLVVYSF